MSLMPVGLSEVSLLDLLYSMHNRALVGIAVSILQVHIQPHRPAAS